MKRIFVLFISGLIISLRLLSQEKEAEVSVIENPISIGFELSGPVIYGLDNSIMNYELSLGYRINQKYMAVLEPGISRYSYSQYNYDYLSSGMFIRIGTDINLLKSKNKPSNHYAGIGLRYGLSLFKQETPAASYSNYWGSHDFSLESKFIHAHFFELSGGVRAELFRNILIGWTFRTRVLIYQSGGEDSKPVNIPGLGGTDLGIQPGFSYHLIWILPFKNKS